MGPVGEHERSRWVVKSPAWGTALWSGMSLVGLAGGVAMTIASGGRPDTSLIPMGPVAILFGLVCGYPALSSRYGQIAVEGDLYTTRGGVRTKTRTVLKSDAVMVRGGLGNVLAYVVVTDSGGQRIRFSLQQGPLAMRQRMAARLLASGADIDPECSYALRQLAGPAAPDYQPVGGPFVRLDSHGRLQVYPFQVLLRAEETGLRVDSKAQAEQIRSVSAERLGPVIGRVPAPEMAQLDDALRIHLQL